MTAATDRAGTVLYFALLAIAHVTAVYLCITDPNDGAQKYIVAGAAIFFWIMIWWFYRLARARARRAARDEFMDRVFRMQQDIAVRRAVREAQEREAARD